MNKSSPSNGVLAFLAEYRKLLLELVALGGALAGLLALKTKLPYLRSVEDWQFMCAAGAILFALTVNYWIRRPASLLKDVRDIDPDRIYGRDLESAGWFQHISNHRLVWLSGESGCGKSTLVRFGIKTLLESSGLFEAVYLSNWGEDWELGPWEALAAELSRMRFSKAVRPADVPELLRRHKDATGRTPVLLLDQFDDYQSQHYDRFLSPDGARLQVEALRKQNSFWAELARLLEEGAIRVLIVTRDDSPYGLECVRLVKPQDTHLARLQPGVAARLLATVVPADGVKDPAAGWNEFSGALLGSLEQKGTLAIQMVRAFRALAYVQNRPIRSGFYERMGALTGLESLPLDYHIRQASRIAACDRGVIVRALVEMIDPREQSKTRAVTLRELSAHLQLDENRTAALGKALEFMADPARKLLRQISAGVWRLDHDYLVGAVSALNDKENILRSTLEKAAERFRLARGEARWRAMLSPREWFRIACGRLLGRVEFGPYRGFFAVSCIRWIIPLLLGAAVVSAPLLYQQHRNVKNAEALDLMLSVSSTRSPENLWKTYDLPEYARLHIFETVLSESDYADSLNQAGVDWVSLLLRFDDGMRSAVLGMANRKCKPTPASQIPVPVPVCALLFNTLDRDYRESVRYALPGYSPDEACLRTDPGIFKEEFERYLSDGKTTLAGDCFQIGAKRLSDQVASGLLERAVDGWLVESPPAGLQPTQGPARAAPEAIYALASAATEPARIESVKRLTTANPLTDERLSLAWGIAGVHLPAPDALVAPLVASLGTTRAGACKDSRPFDPSERLMPQIVRARLAIGDDQCALDELFPGPPSGSPDPRDAEVWQSLTENERKKLAAAALGQTGLTIWQDQAAGPLLAFELTDTEASNLFSKLISLDKNTVSVSDTLFPLALKLKEPVAAETVRKLGPRCKEFELTPVCWLLGKREEFIESQFVPAPNSGPIYFDRSVLAESVEPDLALRILELSLEKVDSAPFGAYSFRDLKLLRDRLGQPARREFEDRLHAEWIRRFKPNDPNLQLQGQAPYWIALLPTQDLSQWKPTLLAGLMSQSGILADWSWYLERLEPDAAARGNIALDQYTGYDAQGHSLLNSSAPGPEVLRFLTVANEDAAWERVRWVVLEWTQRVAIAQRLCELHNCNADMHDRWALAKFALSRGQDMSKPPMVRPRWF
jgi:hypothetical protein